MTTDEHRAALAIITAEADGTIARGLTREEGQFVHGCIEDLNGRLDGRRRNRLLNLADSVVPWHDQRKRTRQQGAAIDALLHASLSPWERGFITRLGRQAKPLSPKQEARLFEVADERTAGWRARLGDLFCPCTRPGVA